MISPHATDPRPLEIGATNDEAQLSVILMHGLGADSSDFADVAFALYRAAAPRRWRFVLPQAKNLPVTINNGIRMPAWYDILSLSHPREVDWETVSATQESIESIIESEKAPQIIVAGFSQGAAMALQVALRNQEKVDGALILSGYLLESEAHPAPSRQEESSLPILVLHGEDDDVVPLSAAHSCLSALKNGGYSPQFQGYPGLGHSVNQEECNQIFQWLDELAPLPEQ